MGLLIDRVAVPEDSVASGGDDGWPPTAGVGTSTDGSLRGEE